jgi:hypothetical protein
MRREWVGEGAKEWGRGFVEGRLTGKGKPFEMETIKIIKKKKKNTRSCHYLHRDD